MRYLTLADVKNRLSEVVGEVETQHERVVVTKHGRPSVVMLAVEDLEGLEETLEILSDRETMAALAEAKADIEAGRVQEVTREEALARWGRGG